MENCGDPGEMLLLQECVKILHDHDPNKLTKNTQSVSRRKDVTVI